MTIPTYPSEPIPYPYRTWSGDRDRATPRLVTVLCYLLYLFFTLLHHSKSSDAPTRLNSTSQHLPLHLPSFSPVSNSLPSPPCPPPARDTKTRSSNNTTTLSRRLPPNTTATAVPPLARALQARAQTSTMPRTRPSLPPRSRRKSTRVRGGSVLGTCQLPTLLDAPSNLVLCWKNMWKLICWPNSAQDKMILEEAYKNNSKPDKQARLALVERVSLTEKEVQVRPATPQWAVNGPRLVSLTRP